MDTLQFCLPFFFGEQADSENMEHQAITPAEQKSHTIAGQTRWAILWTGVAQAIIAALAACLALWKFRVDEKREEEKEEKKEEEKKKEEEEEDRKQAREVRDQLAVLGKRLVDLEVKERAKKRAEEEKKKKKVEREKKEKKEKRKDAANKQHEMASAALGKRLDEIEKDRKAHDERVTELEQRHESDMRLKDQTISDLREDSRTLLRLVRIHHPDWAGDKRETSGTTGR